MTFYRLYARSFQGVLRLASYALDWRPPQVLEGPGSSKRLPALLAEHGHRHVLLVTDQGIMRLGLAGGFLENCKALGIEVSIYDKTIPNPTLENIADALGVYKSQGCQALVALGGGSSLDCAKGVSARLARPKKSLVAMKGILGVGRRGPPLYAIPTTAGTGSEATIVSVVSDPKTHDKYAITDNVLMPRVAVLDPLLTLGLPPIITATTGMDALTHAVEAYIGRSNTTVTKQLALDASSAIFTHLPRVMAEPSNVESRAEMLMASFMAGRAFTRAYIGYIHAVAHTLGGFYGVPHGLANAVLMPLVLENYGSVVHGPLAELAINANLVDQGCDAAEASRVFIDHIRGMNRDFGLPQAIKEIQAKDIPAMVDRAYAEANPLYPVPRILSKEDLRIIYERASP